MLEAVWRRQAPWWSVVSEVTNFSEGVFLLSNNDEEDDDFGLCGGNGAETRKEGERI